MRKLHNWDAKQDPYGAPEVSPFAITGDVEGDPTRPNGRRVTTSPVMSVDGRTIKTWSGTTYWLGEPSPEYRSWLREHRPGWDSENPVTMLGGTSEP